MGKGLRAAHNNIIYFSCRKDPLPRIGSRDVHVYMHLLNVKSKDSKKYLHFKTREEKEIMNELVLHIYLLCIVLYPYIYIAPLAVHTNQKRFLCKRPRKKKM